ncbi:hypothetical protein N7523_008431 [Penicillium sp. IBT 18751x]|nr:hypothetical protein N7523_008431 [Penicillium sp. IBT 18751x]
MVLRKPPPPRLENLNKWRTRSNSQPSSSTPVNCATRARLNRVPSQESVYSPDLNTSPAFDLMPLEEAQRSPVGSPASQPPNSWSESLGDRPATSGPDQTGSDPRSAWPSSAPMPGSHGGDERSWKPAPVENGTMAGEAPVQLRSNNPFLKPRTSESRLEFAEPYEWDNRHSHATTSSDPLSQSEGYIPMTARLSLLDSPGNESSWNEVERPHATPQNHFDERSHDATPWESQHSIRISAPQEIYLQGGQSIPYAPAVVVQPSDPQDLHASRTSYNQGRLGSAAGIRTPSAISSGTSATSHELIDFDGPETLGIETGSHQAASSGAKAIDEKVPTDTQYPQTSSSMLLPPDGTQEQTPSASSANISDAEAARQMEQRSETYSIRKINWTDRTGQLLQSPILVQTQNGPCPLLALINALVLRSGPKLQTPIIRALRSREQISLGLLIEALFEELTTCLGPDEEFPDIEALTRFLTMLHTGMNVNPRLILVNGFPITWDASVTRLTNDLAQETTDSLGTFQETDDLRLYSTFRVPLIHGWVASWSSREHTAMTRVAQLHEDIQLLPFRRQELEDQVMQGRSLSPEEEQTMADIQAIQNFVDVENATQLSPFGLTQLTTQLAPGSVSIFFRNDHFSTLYKHPQSHQLFTLVTDAGYANHAEVVWESLVDVTGFNSEFLAGDFRAVSHGPSETADSTGPAGPRTSSTAARSTFASAETPEGEVSSQEQSDADYAYALSLQFQEEEQREQTGGQSASPTGERTESQQGNPPPRGIRPSGPVRTSQGSSPRLSNPPTRTSSRFTTSHSEPDPDDPNAPPPPYEPATASATGPRYSPPDPRPPYGGHQGGRYAANRYSAQYPPDRPVNSNRYSSSGRNKDCIMM